MVAALDFVAVFQTVQKYSDFTPFPSKLFALLYMLMHSPHRVVCYYTLD